MDRLDNAILDQLEVDGRLTNAELASVTGTSETNAGTRLHRVIGKLREACHETA